MASRNKNFKTIYDYPDLAAWLDEDTCREHQIDPHLVPASTTKILWFKAPNGSKYHRHAVNVVDSFMRDGSLPHERRTIGKAIPGWDDMFTTHPWIKEMWVDEKNREIGLDPTILSHLSGRKAYFYCSACGKVVDEPRFIFSVIKHRRAFCSHCARSFRTSFQEQTLMFYLLKMFPDIENGDRTYMDDKRSELDILIPSKNLAIEYDGGGWHKFKTDSDLEKYLICKEKGLTLIRVSDIETGIKDCDCRIMVSPEPTDSDILRVLQKIAELTGYVGDIPVPSLENDTHEILSRFKIIQKKRSFGSKNPDVLPFWDYEKNHGIDPFSISPNDRRKYWFKQEGFGSYLKRPNDITSGKATKYHPVYARTTWKGGRPPRKKAG